MINFIEIYINLKYTINKSLSDFNDLIFKRDRDHLILILFFYLFVNIIHQLIIHIIHLFHHLLLIIFII